MYIDMEIIRDILLKTEKYYDGSCLLSYDLFKTDKHSFIDIFFYTEALYKAGLLASFQYAETQDYRSTFLIGGLTSIGYDLARKIKIEENWVKEKEYLLRNSIIKVLKQNLRFYFPPYIDGVLWRYMSYEKLESILSTNSLYFCRADLLGDSFEGSSSIPTIENRSKFYEGATREFIENEVPELQARIRETIYISCWHFNVNESALMWRSYGEKDKSIAVKTSIKRLADSIKNEKSEFVLGPIHYIDYAKDPISEANALTPFFYKQKEYEGEREFRIITDKMEIINDMYSNTAIAPKGIFINIDTDALIRSIIISPFSSIDFKSKVIELLEKFNIKNRLIESSVSLTPHF